MENFYSEYISEDDVHNFAEKCRRSSAIAAGRIQKERKNYRVFRNLPGQKKVKELFVPRKQVEMIPALWRSIDTSVKTLLMVIISCHKAFPYISDIPALTSVLNIMPKVYEILFLTLLCQYFGLVDIRSDESGDLKFLYKTSKLFGKLFDWK